MDNELFFLNVMNKTQIVRPPRHTLATFGTTTLHYVLLSEIPEEKDQCRRREGRVTAHRPQIITPELWQKRFEGFGENTDIYKSIMDQLFGDQLRGLEYTFKNELDRTVIEPVSLAEFTNRALDVLNKQNEPRTALLQGPDAAWGLSVMKFIVDMTLRSFPVNYRELDEHDCFDPQKKVQAKTRHYIEKLFREAAVKPASIPKLGEALKESGMFAEYEDRFFALVRR